MAEERPGTPGATPAPGASADPSMEDILASIRRILNEDEPAGPGNPPPQAEPPPGDEPLDLTRRELALLEILVARGGRIVGKEQIVERLFGLDGAAGANAVEQYVARLRRKIAASRAEIRTLRGLGYQLVPR